MSRGNTHALATIILAGAGGLVVHQLGHPIAHTAAIAGGALAGLVLTPDLDLDEGCIANDIVRRTAGRKVERLWSLFWLPYSRLIRHRSHLSHLPLLGTALRLAYLLGLPLLLLWMAGQAPAPQTVPVWAWWATGGLVLADVLHYVMDNL